MWWEIFICFPALKTNINIAICLKIWKKAEIKSWRYLAVQWSYKCHWDPNWNASENIMAQFLFWVELFSSFPEHGDGFRRVTISNWQQSLIWVHKTSLWHLWQREKLLLSAAASLCNILWCNRFYFHNSATSMTQRYDTQKMYVTPCCLKYTIICVAPQNWLR